MSKVMIRAAVERRNFRGAAAYNNRGGMYRGLKSGHWKSCGWNWKSRSQPNRAIQAAASSFPARFRGGGFLSAPGFPVRTAGGFPVCAAALCPALCRIPNSAARACAPSLFVSDSKISAAGAAEYAKSHLVMVSRFHDPAVPRGRRFQCLKTYHPSTRVNMLVNGWF